MVKYKEFEESMELEDVDKHYVSDEQWNADLVDMLYNYS